MKPILLSLLLGTAAFLTSCAPSTPQARIEKNPGLYSQLNTRQQELVSRGQIDEGMPSSAVYLALGKPDRRLDGVSRGTRTMRWDYTSLTPVYHNSFYSHYGYGWGRGRYGRRYGGFGFAPSINYVPTRSATVWFEDDLVRSFERVRR